MGEWIATGLPSPLGVSFMPRLKVPETCRMNAIRSRWLGSMFAWTLKMKPVTSSRVGGICSSPAGCGRGGGAYFAIASISSVTPKFFRADPK